MPSQIAFTRLGYEYRYGIERDDTLLRSYQEHIMCSCACYVRSFILEVRTNFISKPRVDNVEDITDSENFAMILRAGEEVMESERFASILPLGHRVDEDEEVLMESIWYRLFEYWFPGEKIRSIADKAFCFVKRMRDDPQYDYLGVIPVVLEIDVCTVQLQGESLDATIRRSIKPNRLIPLQVWGMSIVLGDGSRPGGFIQTKEACVPNFRRGSLIQTKETNAMCVLRMYLMDLPRERVEDVGKGLTRMESCPICLEAPTYGTQITPLPCNHIFHNHCIVRWLMNTKACPVCHLAIKDPLAEEEEDQSADQSSDDEEIIPRLK